MLKIIEVAINSVGEELGIKSGDTLNAFNDVPVRDILDYLYYDGQENFVMTVTDTSGETVDFEIEKDAAETLGLSFAEELETRSCYNKCVFCFVDQLPENMRETLYFKDDDWRFSFISGNYVTLTNLLPGEIERITEQKFSPIYISVHATDPVLRASLLGRKKDSDIMPYLYKLHECGIEVHAQCVLCPELNTGEQLEKSIEDLAPLVRSLALVPVGLTKYSNPHIIPFSAETAASVLNIVDKAQKKCLNTYNTRKVFAADELYLKANRAMPEYEEYEDFPQIENGVGMCAKLLREVVDALAETKNFVPRYSKLTIATGRAAYPLMRKICDMIFYGTGAIIDLRCVENKYFGGSVNVAGLITGNDLIDALRGTIDSDCLLIARNMLKETEHVFLDGVTLAAAEKELGTKIIPVENTGYALLGAIVREKN